MHSHITTRLRPWLGLLPLFLLLGLIFIWPLVMLFAGSFRTAPPGFEASWSFIAWRETFFTPGTSAAIVNSLYISLITTSVSTVLAAGLAFLSERTDTPLRRWITPALLVMFATPTLFYAMGYSLLGNAYTGTLNRVLQWLFGLENAVIDIESWGGLLTVMTLKKVSVIYLFLIGPFRALNPTHDDASLVSGVGQFGTFFRINLPTLAPALTSAILLGIVSGLQAFDVVLILGWPFKLQVISTQIMDFTNGAGLSSYAHASVLSIVLIAVVAILCVIQARVLGSRSFITVSGKGGSHRRIRLTRSRYLFGTLIFIYLLLAAILPIGSVVFTSFQPFPGVYENFSLQHYENVLATPRVLESIQATFTLAIATGVITMLLAVVVARTVQRVGVKIGTALRFTTLIPLAMPGVVTALAISWGFLSLPGFKMLYGTGYLVMIALIICVTPFAVQIAHSAIAQIAPELEESARLSGASAPQAMFDIVMRLIAPSFLAGWFMVAIIVTGNLEIPLLLKAPGLNPIAMLVYDLNGRGNFSGASALLVVLLLAKAAVWFAGLALFKLLVALARWRQRRLAAVVAGRADEFSLSLRGSEA